MSLYEATVCVWHKRDHDGWIKDIRNVCINITRRPGKPLQTSISTSTFILIIFNMCVYTIYRNAILSITLQNKVKCIDLVNPLGPAFRCTSCVWLCLWVIVRFVNVWCYPSGSCVWIMEAWVKWSHITTDSPETPNKRPGFHRCACVPPHVFWQRNSCY